MIGCVFNFSIVGMVVEIEVCFNVGESYCIGMLMNQDGCVVWCYFCLCGNVLGELVVVFQLGIEFVVSVFENVMQIFDFIDCVGNVGVSCCVFGCFEIGDVEVLFCLLYVCSVLSFEGDMMMVEVDFLLLFDIQFEFDVEGVEGRFIG